MKKSCWDMTDEERAAELFSLFRKAEEVLASGSDNFRDALDTGFVYSPTNCIKYGYTGAGMLQGLRFDERRPKPDIKYDINRTVLENSTKGVLQ